MIAVEGVPQPVLDHRIDPVPERLLVDFVDALDDLVAALSEGPLEPVKLALGEP